MQAHAQHEQEGSDPADSGREQAYLGQHERRVPEVQVRFAVPSLFLKRGQIPPTREGKAHGDCSCVAAQPAREGCIMCCVVGIRTTRYAPAVRADAAAAETSRRAALIRGQNLRFPLHPHHPERDRRSPILMPDRGKTTAVRRATGPQSPLKKDVAPRHPESFIRSPTTDYWPPTTDHLYNLI